MPPSVTPRCTSTRATATWVPTEASVLTPFTPEPSDVLNAPANSGDAPGLEEPLQRLSVPTAPTSSWWASGPPATISSATARRAPAHSPHIWLRTARHPAAASFGPDGASTTSTTSGRHVRGGLCRHRRTLVAAATAAAPEPVVYAVPGSPLVAERTVELLRADERVDVTIVPALSFLDLAWGALGIDPLAEGVRLVDATEFAGRGRARTADRSWWPSAGRATCSRRSSWRVDDATTAPPRPVLLHHLGLADEVVATVDWWELDRTIEPDHLTSLYVPRLADHAGAAAGVQVARLVALMDTLRECCPWDRAQTTRRSCRTWSRSPTRCSMPSAHWPPRSRASRRGAGLTGGRRLRPSRRGTGRPLFQIVFHARLAGEVGALRPGRRGPDRARQAGASTSPRLRRRRGRRRRTGRGELGGDQEEREGESERHRGDPGRAAGPRAHEQAGPQGTLGRRRADDPAMGAGGRRRPARRSRSGHLAKSRTPTTRCGVRQTTSNARWAMLLFAVVNLAQRVGVDAEQALRDRALVAARGHPRRPRASPISEVQPLVLAPGVPPGRTPRSDVVSTIEHVIGREVLDSRGNPTVEAEVLLDSGARVVAPSRRRAPPPASARPSSCATAATATRGKGVLRAVATRQRRDRRRGLRSGRARTSGPSTSP